jgi:hypothetical protein
MEFAINPAMIVTSVSFIALGPSKCEANAIKVIAWKESGRRIEDIKASL